MNFQCIQAAMTQVSTKPTTTSPKSNQFARSRKNRLPSTVMRAKHSTRKMYTKAVSKAWKMGSIFESSKAESSERSPTFTPAALPSSSSSTIITSEFIITNPPAITFKYFLTLLWRASFLKNTAPGPFCFDLENNRFESPEPFEVMGTACAELPL